jgi:hypothetical protein
VSQPTIAPTRLPRGAEKLIGREEELQRVDAAWNNPKIHVVTIVAWGGVGKTSLVFEWMARKAAQKWKGFARVFDWSFYSQGTRDQGAASAGGFLAAALEFFGGNDGKNFADSPMSPWDKGAKLVEFVRRTPSLLVLDGLEPLQYPPGPLVGQLKDPALTALLRGLAQHNTGLCLVTTRERLTDLAPFRNTTMAEFELAHLSVPAGVQLLEQLGVRGSRAELMTLVNEVKGHALTLNLLGSYCATKKNSNALASSSSNAVTGVANKNSKTPSKRRKNGSALPRGSVSDVYSESEKGAFVDTPLPRS